MRQSFAMRLMLIRICLCIWYVKRGLYIYIYMYLMTNTRFLANICRQPSRDPFFNFSICLKWYQRKMQLKHISSRHIFNEFLCNNRRMYLQIFSFRGFYLKVTLTIGNCFPFWLQNIYLLNTLYAIEM